MDQDTQVEKPGTPASTLDGLRANFPFPTCRPAQDLAMQVMAKAHDERNQFSIFELPTGSGKSPLGIAAARWSATLGPQDAQPGAHYLTSQNTLSTQLMNDFEKYGLTQIRGKSNYSCATKGTDCNTGSMLNGGKTCESCPYRAAKNAYLASPLGVTNYTYYLTERMYVRELEPRNYLILDEAHNIEREILAMVDITITKNRCDFVGAGRLPFFEPKQDDRVCNWLMKNFLPELNRKLDSLKKSLSEARESGRRPSVEAQKQAQGLEQLRRNICTYMDEVSTGDWFAWSESSTGSLLIKPLTAAAYANRYLFEGSPNVVMLSATILDFATFKRNLGISGAKKLAVPSEFPAKTRRIVYWPVGSMSAKNIDATLPRLAERTDALLTKFADKKGIIHTHTYKISNYLDENLRRTAHGRRLLTHTAASGSREEAIEMHYETPDPTILMSPSMTEGLDLRGDLGRINIITKVPYLFLDPYNRARMERDPKWYQLQAALSLVQASGRCNRSEDDNALTVILDSDFGRFLSQNQDILPRWWLDSIEFR